MTQDGEALMLYLDSYNIAASTGSACTTQSTDPSHVILALGRPAELVAGSMRFTLGRDTKKTDLDYALKVIPGLVEELLDPADGRAVELDAQRDQRL